MPGHCKPLEFLNHISPIRPEDSLSMTFARNLARSLYVTDKPCDDVVPHALARSLCWKRAELMGCPFFATIVCSKSMAAPVFLAGCAFTVRG